MARLRLKEHFIALYYLYQIRPQHSSANTPYTSKSTQRFCWRWSQTAAYVSAYQVKRDVASEASCRASGWREVRLTVQNCDAFHFPSHVMKRRPLVTQTPVSCYPDARGPIMTELSVRSSSVSFFETGLTNTSAALTSWTTRFEAPRPSLVTMPLCNLFSPCVPIQRWSRSHHLAHSV